MIVIPHGYRDGLCAEELYALVPGMRNWLNQFMTQWEQWGGRFVPEGTTINVEWEGQRIATLGDMASFNLLARARRAKQPGIVFTRAAAIGERDPLADIDSRLFVGLPPI